MSGPKSSRYTLTAKQREAIRKVMELEQQLSVQRDIASGLQSTIVSLKSELCDIEHGLSVMERWASVSGEIKTELKKAQDTLEQLLNNINLNERNLSDFTKSNKLMKESVDSVVETVSQLKTYKDNMELESAKQISNVLLAEISLNLSPITHNEKLDSKNIMIKKITEDVYELPQNCIERTSLLCNVDKIKNEENLRNYYSLTVLPIVKKYRKNRAEYDAIIAEYCYYSKYLSVEQDKYSIADITKLREDVKHLKQNVEAVEEQAYIASSVDQVMQEMGYLLAGERQVEKKNGKHFSNHIYDFSDGTVINATFSANGQITMELAGTDHCDRAPSISETDQLCREMEEFCSDFKEIEERLREKGVIIDKRLSMMSPAPQYAQIINIDDYTITGNIEIESVCKKKTEKRKQRRSVENNV